MSNNHFCLFHGHIALVCFFLINFPYLAFGFSLCFLILYLAIKKKKDLGLVLFCMTVLKLIIFFYTSYLLEVHVKKHPGTYMAQGNSTFTPGKVCCLYVDLLMWQFSELTLFSTATETGHLLKGWPVFHVVGPSSSLLRPV